MSEIKFALFKEDQQLDNQVCLLGGSQTTTDTNVTRISFITRQIDNSLPMLKLLLYSR